MQITRSFRSAQLISRIGGFQLSRLNSGLRVLTYNDGSAVLGLGLFSMCGSAFETPQNYGSAAVLDAMLLKGNDIISQPNLSHCPGSPGQQREGGEPP